MQRPMTFGSQNGRVQVQPLTLAQPAAAPCSFQRSFLKLSSCFQQPRGAERLAWLWRLSGAPFTGDYAGFGAILGLVTI